MYTSILVGLIATGILVALIFAVCLVTGNGEYHED